MRLLFLFAVVSGQALFENATVPTTTAPTTTTLPTTTLPINAKTSTAAPGEQRCVWYGVCHTDPSGTTKQNCLNDTTPLPMKDTHTLGFLKQLCPEFTRNLTKDNPYPSLCCDSEQIQVFQTNMAVPRQVFERCPSCFRNFAELWCQSTCAPNQRDFIEVIETKNTTGKVKKEYITGINYYLDDAYKTGMYKACRNVQFPGSNQRALELVCGTEISKCTPDVWLKYLGDKKTNALVPFQINFKTTNSSTVISEGVNYHPMNVSTIPCNKAVDEDSLPCSCQDCVSSCRPTPPYPQDNKDGMEIIGMHVVPFTLFLGLSVFCVVFTACGMFQNMVGGQGPAYADAKAAQGYAPPQALVAEDEIRAWDRVGAWVEARMEAFFISWGVITTRHPALVFLFGLTLALLCSLGLIHVEFTTDPVELWSNPNSQARTQKDYFDQQFGPFYRTEQLIIAPNDQALWERTNWAKGIDEIWGPVFHKEFLEEVLALQNHLAAITVEYDNRTVGLKDICFQPLSPDVKECTIQSVLNYFQNNQTMLDHVVEVLAGELNYLDHISSCVNGPTQVNDTNLHTSCLGTYGGPVFPFVALGGFDATNYTEATAVVITYVVNNHVNKTLNGPAEAWEFEFIRQLKAFKSPNFTIAYNSERSIQDEIKRESESDIFTILVSYLFMFGYIVFALGQYNVYRNNLGYLLVQSKIVLGFLGVMIVFLSVTSSIGVYAFCGIPATMIILEVQPFLVLAVGVDNIFIFVQAYQRDLRSKERTLEERIGRISGEVIPSMLLSSSAECLCFFLGALSSMPAVRTFSLYAGLAIFFDFFLQITCFLAVFTLDIRRQESGRMEPFCWPRLQPQANDSEGFLYSLFRDYYTPFITSKPVRYVVVIFFSMWLASSIAVIDKIELGLDQSLSMPQDSYVLRYFQSLNKYLSVGPPVYFVVKGEFDYMDPESQNKLCGSAGCEQESLYGQISTAAAWKNRCG